MQRDQALQRIGQFRPVRRHAARVAVARRVMGMRQVVGSGQARTEGLAVGDDAAHRNAAEAHAMVAALAADHPEALALAARAVVREGDLQCGVHRLGTRVGEEQVVQVAGEEGLQPPGQLEGQRVAHLEGGREVHGVDLARDRVGDGLAAMAGVHAPQARGRVEDLSALGRPVMHALGARQQPRVLLELPVGGEGHPEGVQPRRIRRGGLACVFRVLVWCVHVVVPVGGIRIRACSRCASPASAPAAPAP